MGERRGRNLAVVLLAVGLLLMTVPLQESIHQLRPHVFDPERKAKPTSLISHGPMPAVIAALGGFRTVAADLLWLRVEREWDGGNWWALPQLLDTVTQLDPHFVLAWKVYGWHLAYNLHVASETQVDKRRYLEGGIKALEGAVEANPDDWEIVFELGWTLYDRAHEPWRAAEYFRKADQLPDAKPYVTRMIYRCYEGVLDIPNLMEALEYAKGRHTDPNSPFDVKHQQIVNRDYDWWQKHKDDRLEHRRQIVTENTARAQRSRPFYLYPDNPYWDVCPVCGLPSPKGSEFCSAYGHPLKPSSGSRPSPGGSHPPAEDTST
jgi:hypothetical protein